MDRLRRGALVSPELMLLGLPILRITARKVALTAALCLLPTLVAVAQDEASSLGDIARDLRKNKAQQANSPQPERPVIDNENLHEVMEDVRKARPVSEEKSVLSIDPASNSIKVSAPDVTCSLSFNARASSLLIRPVLIEDLPLTDLLKLDGPGSIQDENLQVEVFNGTDWDIREITIGLTIERRPGEDALVAAGARVILASETTTPAVVERHSDVTLLYHLKAEALPFSTTAFRENIGITPGPDEDWRWSIVEAKGVRPSPTGLAPLPIDGH